MTFEEWWTEPAPQTGNSYQDVYGDASGIVRLAFEAGQRAERKPVTFTVAPTGYVLVDATVGSPERAYEEGWNDALAAIRNRKDQA